MADPFLGYAQMDLTLGRAVGYVSKFGGSPQNLNFLWCSSLTNGAPMHFLRPRRPQISPAGSRPSAAARRGSVEPSHAAAPAGLALRSSGSEVLPPPSKVVRHTSQPATMAQRSGVKKSCQTVMSNSHQGSMVIWSCQTINGHVKPGLNDHLGS